MPEVAEGIAHARRMGVDPEHGLSSPAAEESLARHGPNRLPAPRPRRAFAIFLDSLKDKTLLILMGAAVLSLGVEAVRAAFESGYSPHYVDGFAIFAAIGIASLVTTFNEVRASKKFGELSALRADVPVKVLRDGTVGKRSVHDVVVGDVTYFDAGDRLPADGVLLRGVEVAIDQSTLTGESEPVEKGGEDVELRGGTTVTAGSGAMIVTAVGAASEIGRLQLSLSQVEHEPTPLQERLGLLADRIGWFGLASAILTFCALAISSFVRNEIQLAPTMETIGALLQYALIAVTIVVVAVPEGLPLAVTISLAYSVQKMARAKNLVRKLASCETMGAATVICSDKTGTLTMNRMSVVGGWLGGKRFDAAPEMADLPPWVVERITEVVSVNSTAFIEIRDQTTNYVGNPTECALLAWVASWAKDWAAVRKSAAIVRQIGFTSERKRMSTLVEVEPPSAQDRGEEDRRDEERHRGDRNGRRLLVKGAPEAILDRTSSVLETDTDRVSPFSPTRRAEAMTMLEAFSGTGARTLALAYRTLEKDEVADAMVDPAAERLERDLVLIGLVAIADPLREDVREAVDASLRAGVEVKMVTGDNLLTARAIATQIGLIKEGDIVVDGPTFRAMSDEDVARDLGRLRVLARSVPSDKLRLVGLLKAARHVVAVTGDGTNDAPALASADVGFAMGLTGTEVAKEASDIVLLDDNFASIVDAILWGRSIFANIRKFLQFQLTVNVVAVSTAFLAAVLGFGIPLNTVQLLWVNLIMDTLAALALATEAPTRDLLDHRPHGRHEPLITSSMWIQILAMGSVMVAMLVVIMATDWVLAASVASNSRLTFVFNTFVMMQLFNELNARATRFDASAFRGLSQSPLFVLVVVVTLVAQVAIVQLGGAFFRTTPLSSSEWALSVAIGSLVLPVGAFVRALGRRFVVRRPIGDLSAQLGR
ncbi:MAG: calcium-translocating P-type ATPase, PMCA-type [Deltaproteobacteria bacterium]|nr:calcium-translocating P-type ATPase, PMCA-type [Deltaproteobacteria bacterium]